jgi:RNA polymerase sigma-54 factor
MKLRQNATIKGKLSTTLKSWLPILQSSVVDLEDEFKKFESENPYLKVKSAFEKDFSSTFSKRKESSTDNRLESYSIYEKSLYEFISEQIVHPLFPTDKSKNIATKIIESLNSEGYFEGDIETLADEIGVSAEEFEKVRLRFGYIEPSGIGALDLIESFRFQLNHCDISDNIYNLVSSMLGDFENMHKFKSDELYQEALSVIKGFKNPPAIEFLQKEPDVIPDIFVDITDNYIEVNLNDKYYPSVKVAVEGNDKSMDFVKMKLKEAKDLVDALEMRKATLYKLGLMIVEHQYEFFLGGDIKPMRLKDLSEDLDYNQSTISRAISNKYLECNRGVISLKDFFSTAIDEDLSNTSIKEFIKEIVKNENRDRPLSDIKILELIEKKFSITLSRRTITKYRKQLDISSSSERKSLYKLGG